MTWTEVLAEEAARWSAMIRERVAALDPVWAIALVAAAVLVWRLIQSWERGRNPKP